MAFSKITLNGVTLMDVTQDTVTAANLLDGFIATAADGSRYEGTIATKGESDLTASGSKVTVPSGYYATAASKAIAAGSATTPATTITANPGITVSATGLITATNSKTQNVTPTVTAGYVSAGTSGTITVSGSNTSQLSTQAAATITPTESSQTAVAAGKYTTGAVTVAAISSNYIGSNIATRSAADLTASGPTVSVPSGYYAAAATKTISSGSATTPATTISVTPTISVSSSGLITATAASSKSVTPTVSAGYISSGTAGTVTVNGSNTSQLSIYNGAHHVVLSLDVSLTNPIDLGYFGSVKIYKTLDGTDIGSQYTTINSATGSATIDLDPLAWGVVIEVNSSLFEVSVNTNTGIICTGGASYVRNVSSNYGQTCSCWFQITGSGTITLDRVDYNKYNEIEA